jgi:uncharacterized membrane protein required for colicin V production
MVDQIQDFAKNLTFSYIDGFVLIWLIVGLLRGRKRGMTQEFLPCFKWLGIVLLGGYFNQPLAALIRQYAGAAYDVQWSCISAYALIALAVSLLFALFKHLLGDKLTGSDVFGRYEYYLGILAGLIRYACMLLAVLAIMHSRIITKAETDAIDAQMKKNLEDIHPPQYAYGCFEQAIFFQSFSGKFVQADLSGLLLPTVLPKARPATESMKKKLQDAVDNPMGTGKK